MSASPAGRKGQCGTLWEMEPTTIAYLTGWLAACAIAIGLLARAPRRCSICSRAYRRWLAAPWKLVTFTIATTGLTLIAPYTGDPTWDYVDALLMAALTFATAPWAIGTLYLGLRGRTTWDAAFVAACLWLLSASWSYDGYLLLRDGRYPDTWLSNLFASSVLYVAAGMLWNLEWRPPRGVIFGFMEPGWPLPASGTQFARLVWMALPFMALATAAILYFVVPVEWRT